MLISFVAAFAMIACFIAGLFMFELLLASSKSAVWGLLPVVFLGFLALAFALNAGLRVGFVTALLAIGLLLVYIYGRKRKKRLEEQNQEK